MGLHPFEVSFHYLGPYALLPTFQIAAYALTEQSAGTPGKPRAAQPSAGNSRAESGGKKDNIMSRASRTRDELTELIDNEGNPKASCMPRHPRCNSDPIVAELVRLQLGYSARRSRRVNCQSGQHKESRGRRRAPTAGTIRLQGILCRSAHSLTVSASSRASASRQTASSQILIGCVAAPMGHLRH